MVMEFARGLGVMPAPKSRAKAKTAPVLQARAAAAKSLLAQADSATPAKGKAKTAAWERGSALPRSIRTRLMARAAKPAPAEDKAAARVVGHYLGGEMPAAPKRAAAKPAAKPAAAVGALDREAGQGTLYMDDEGHVHLGIHPGDDKELFDVLRRLESEEAAAAAASQDRRVPAMAEARRAARAAAARAPRLERPAAKRASKRVATHAWFQPRHGN